MSRARNVWVLLLAGLVLVTGGPASAQDEPSSAEPHDQIVLSGDVVVRRGQEAGEIVVLRGTVTVAGVVRGDVVVVDGAIRVTGQVSGTVVNVTGPVLLGPSAQVRGDVLARGRVRAAPGAQVQGDVREGVTFAFRTPIDAFGSFAPWLAIWSSVLALGLLLLLLAPRGADAVAAAARDAPWASTGWGVVAFVGLPPGAAVGVVSLVLLPLGLGLLLALFLLYSVGLSWSAFSLGRVIWHEPRGRVLAFVIGWGILSALAAIPIVGAIVWVAGSAFGLGASVVAAWRARRSDLRVRAAGGRHRAGGKMPVRIPEAAEEPEPMAASTPDATATRDPEPMPVEPGTGEEGAAR